MNLLSPVDIAVGELTDAGGVLAEGSTIRVDKDMDISFHVIDTSYSHTIASLQRLCVFLYACMQSVWFCVSRRYLKA